jgi:hypothetical protein
MPSNHYSSDRGVEHHDTFRRAVPRCYSRPGMSKAISESRIDRESNAILIGLSVITCVVGGGIGGQILQAVLGIASSGNLDIGSIIAQIVSGGVGGGVLMTIVGGVKQMMGK